ncbi:hypothetical protein LSAT2_031730, partial [Lamellibrachia satsuma]
VVDGSVSDLRSTQAGQHLHWFQTRKSDSYPYALTQAEVRRVMDVVVLRQDLCLAGLNVQLQPGESRATQDAIHIDMTSEDSQQTNLLQLSSGSSPINT